MATCCLVAFYPSVPPAKPLSTPPECLPFLPSDRSPVDPPVDAPVDSPVDDPTSPSATVPPCRPSPSQPAPPDLTDAGEDHQPQLPCPTKPTLYLYWKKQPSGTTSYRWWKKKTGKPNSVTEDRFCTCQGRGHKAKGCSGGVSGATVDSLSDSYTVIQLAFY